jgi:hypothetical protein
MVTALALRRARWPLPPAVRPLLVVLVVIAVAALGGGAAAAATTPYATEPHAQAVMACDDCVQHGNHHCDAPVRDAVRDTSPHKEPRHVPVCGQPPVPGARAHSTDTSRLTGEPPGPPDLHRLQRLRV